MPENPSAAKRAEWAARATRKSAIVPKYFEVSPRHVLLDCGQCGRRFQRNLVLGVDEPVFVCPDEGCRARNWVPVKFDLRR